MYKLIALDLDGTLKNSKNKITDETRETLIKAQQLGAKIVLASGRPTPGLRHEAAALELEKYEGYLLSFNGAMVMDAKTRQTMFEQRLTIEQAKKAYDKEEIPVGAVIVKDGKIIARGYNKKEEKKLKKLLEKQKRGKKIMRQIGNVEVPQEAFLAVLKLDDE